MRKRVTFLFALLLGFATSQSIAQTYTLNFVKWSGDVRLVGVRTIDKITFNDDELLLAFYSGDSERIELDSVRKFYFTMNPSDNMDVKWGSNALSVTLCSFKTLCLHSLADGAHDVEIYSTMGSRVHQETVLSVSPKIDVSHLNAGVYIVKIENQTIKFVLR